MVEPTELEIASLKKKLELNLTAQVEVKKEIAARDDARNKLVKDVSQSQGGVFDALGAYTDYPTPANRRQLFEARRKEEITKRALIDFDLLSGNDDLNVLAEHETKIRDELRSIKINQGSNCFVNECERLKESLIKDFPRYLALTSILLKIPPGVLNVEHILLDQLNYRSTFEQTYQDILKELQ